MGRINGTRGAKIKWVKIEGSENLREAKFEKNKVGHFTEHGWTNDGQSISSKDYLPQHVEEILYNDAIQDKESEENDGECDVFDELEENDGKNDLDEGDDEDIEMVDFS